MDEKVIQWAVLAVVVLAQGILTALKIIEKRNGRKQTYEKEKPTEKTNRNPNRFSKYWERIASLETDVTNIKNDIEDINRKLEKK